MGPDSESRIGRCLDMQFGPKVLALAMGADAHGLRFVTNPTLNKILPVPADAAGWAYIDCKRPHTHDVRTLLTLASAGEAPLMLSAGNDAQLLAHSGEPALHLLTAAHGHTGAKQTQQTLPIATCVSAVVNVLC